MSGNVVPENNGDPKLLYPGDVGGMQYDTTTVQKHDKSQACQHGGTVHGTVESLLMDGLLTGQLLAFWFQSEAKHKLTCTPAWNVFVLLCLFLPEPYVLQHLQVAYASLRQHHSCIGLIFQAVNATLMSFKRNDYHMHMNKANAVVHTD